MSDVMDFEEACDFLRFKPSKLYTLTSTEQIPFYKVGNHLRFSRTRLIQWLIAQERGACELPQHPLLLVAEEGVEYGGS